MFSARLTTLLLVCLLTVGCGKRGDLAKVTGVVTFNGQPFEGAIVQFEPLQGKGSVSAGLTDSKGRYKLMHTLDTKGCMLGEHQVTIRTAAAYYEEEGEAPQKELIPFRYNSRSELRRTVQPGSNTFDFELTRP